MGASVRDFLSRVVPWPGDGPGYVNAVWKNVHGRIGHGRPFKDVDEFMAFTITWGNAHPAYVKDMYFCTSLQARTGGVDRGGKVFAARSAADALGQRSLFTDLDCGGGKGYKDHLEAFNALQDFVKATGLNYTALVNSGGGWHVYWISQQILSPQEWKEYAEGFWALVLKHGLKADPTVTRDAARILRVPGTFNHKTMPPREVQLKFLAKDDIDFAKVMPRQAVTAPVTSARTSAATLFDPALFPPKTPLAADLGTSEYLVDPVPIIAQCPHFKDAYQKGGDYHSQGLWMNTVLATTFFRENSVLLAHKFSKGHAAYTPDETDKMYDRKIGEGLRWPTCALFEREGSKFCGSCKFKGQIKSPLNLKAPTPPSIPMGAAGAPTPGSLHLPRGYVIDPKTNHIGYMRTDDDGTDFVELFYCELSDPWAEKGSERILNFVASADGGTFVDVSVKYEDMFGQSAVQKLVKQGCLVNPTVPTKLRDFLMNWLKELHNAKESLHAVPFGWYTPIGADDVHGFAYGGVIYKDDGTTIKSGAGDALIKTNYNPRGSKQPWLDALKLITAQHRPSVEVIVAASFASPLIKHTGQYSGVLNGHSETGGHKTTAVKIGLAVWGHPLLTKIAADTSVNSMIGNAGTLRNLPMYWDEVSSDERVERAVKTTSEITEGKGPGRMNQNRDQRNTGDWANLLIVTSNPSIWDKLATKIKSNNAQLMRCFAFEVKPGVKGVTPGWVSDADCINTLAKLDYNCGKIGEEYARALGSNPLGVRALVQSEMDRFGRIVNHSNPERFWIAMCGSLLAGMFIANQLGASFNIKEVEEFLVEAYNKLRDAVTVEANTGGSMTNTTDALSEFINTHTDQIIRAENLPAPKPGRHQKVQADGPDINRGYTISMCFDKTRKLFKLSRSEFEKFLEKTHRQRTAVFDGLRQHYGAETTRAAITFGSYYTGGPQAILVMPVEEGTWLWDQMYKRTAESEMPAPTHSDQSEDAPSDAESVQTPS